jgi:hypothetical protein
VNVTGPSRLELERAAEEPPCRLGDHHAARLGECLQSRRQIRRVAHDCLFLRRALSDDVADHDNACRDADTDFQGLVGARFELGNNGGNVEAGPDRPLGVFLMGPRKAKIGQHAIAHEFGDEPIVTRDHAQQASWYALITWRWPDRVRRSRARNPPRR